MDSGPAGIRILIADDALAIRDRLSTELQECNGVAQIVMAENGKAAIEEIQRGLPDVAILDVRMPEFSGFDVLAWIRQHHPGCFVVLHSFDDGGTLGDYALRAGADCFVDKRDGVEPLIEALANQFGLMR